MLFENVIDAITKLFNKKVNKKAIQKTEKKAIRKIKNEVIQQTKMKIRKIEVKTLNASI